MIGNAVKAALIAVPATLVAGCYEDVSPTNPQASTPQQAPAPAKQGPITSFGNQGNSALGGAKRSAENIAADAQRKSQEIADQAGDPGD
jgi:hypothetical protein